MADANLSSSLSDIDTVGANPASVSDGGQDTGSNLSSAVQQQPDLPRFQRTFGNTLKSMLIGLGMGGVPGLIEGGIDPQRVQQTRDNRLAVQQANVTFANARAAHEVAMAHQADAEYQALPEKLQQQADTRGLENLAAAKAAGYLPVASVPLDQGTEQNSQNAMTALNQVKQQFGAVPSGLLYIHTGSGMTVLKLQDPNAALPTINQVRRAQGMPEIDSGTFATFDAKDKEAMARDALNFTNPTDINGQVTQNSLNQANMRLATVKAQPEFNGKDALVTQLQNTVDHQKAVLDSGAQQEAMRAGQAQGEQAQAAEPGKTAAQVANIKATAGPEAQAAAMKAGAEERARNKADMDAIATGGGKDILGETFSPPPGGIKEYNKVKDSFKKDADGLAKTEGTFNQFNDVLNDINAGKNISGAASVVALFNAIGISAEPLQGKGFRINNNTVEEHANARGLGQDLYQKFLSLKDGDVITPQQIKDYAQIAMRSRHDAYVNKINEARSAGVNPSFLLPRGNGKKIDSNTASIFYDAAAGANPQEKSQNALNAAKQLGWQ